MRLLAATQRVLEPDEHNEVCEGLDQRWDTFLSACGLGILPIPNNRTVAVAIVERAQPVGVLLTGGGDLLEYGGVHPHRQLTEMALVGFAERQGLPVLGICRGMQLLLHLSGASLVKVSGHVGVHHPLHGTQRLVNSYHRLGAADVGNDWSVTATSGGVVEAVEHRFLPRTGIMWHPEREPTPVEQDISLFRRRFGV